eukprot:IDg13093t1
MTDAISFGLGGVLLQVGDNSKWRPVAYTSKTLNKVELAYMMTVKECYTVSKGATRKTGPPGVGRTRIQLEMVYEKGSNLVIPDTLIRDAVRKPLCQRCFGSIENFLRKTLNTQSREFGDLPAAADADSRKIEVENGVLRTAIDGDLAVVFPQELKTTVSKHVHGTSPTGHYQARRIFARLRGRFWWKWWMKDVTSFLKSCIPCIASSDSKPSRQAPM